MKPAPILAVLLALGAAVPAAANPLAIVVNDTGEGWVLLTDLGHRIPGVLAATRSARARSSDQGRSGQSGPPSGCPSTWPGVGSGSAAVRVRSARPTLGEEDPAWSVISIGEIHKGIVQHPPAKAGAMWEHWQLLLQPFAPLDFTVESAMIWGRLLNETRMQPIGPRDLLIAATGMAYGMTVVTHNLREFQRVEGLRVEDWQVGSGP